MAWRISNFPWTGGAAVSESILRPDVLSEVIKESHFNGKRFSKNLPEYLDPWRSIMVETLQEFDFTKMTEIFSIIKNVPVALNDLINNFPEPVLVPPALNSKGLGQNIKEEMVLPRKLPITSTEIDSNSYENKSSGSFSLSAPSSIGVITRLDEKETLMESKLGRSIAMIREYLSRAKIGDNSNSKYSEEHKRSQLGKAIDLIDKIRLDYENFGSTTQWDEIEVLESEAKLEIKKNLNALAEIEVVGQNQHHLPKGVLPYFEAGENCDYHDFKDQMCRILSKYKLESLKLSTLRSQIRGPKKASILEKFKHATTLQSAFEMLQPHFGDFSVILPKLKAQLMELPSNPVLRPTESSNVEKLLNFLNLLQKHQKTHIVDDDFLYHFQHKLSDKRMSELRDDGIDNFHDFKNFLLKIQSTNLNLSLTQSFSTTEDTGQTKRRTRGVNLNLSNSTSEEKSSIECGICKQNHRLLDCEKLKNEPDMKKKIKILIDSRLCISCLKGYNNKHKCSAFLKRFKCENHKCNVAICGCPPKSREVHNNSSRNFGLGLDQELDNSWSGQDLEPDNSESKSDSKVNKIEVGAVGFFCEYVSIIDKNGKNRKEMIAYDTLASHCTVDKRIVDRANYNCVDLNTKIITYTYVGRKMECGRKASLKIQGSNGGVVSLDFLVSDEYKSSLTPINYDIPVNLQKRYKLSSCKSNSGVSHLICGMDRFDLHPRILHVTSNGVVIAKSKITGNIILAGRGEFQDQDKNNHYSEVGLNKSVSLAAPEVSLIGSSGPMSNQEEKTRDAIASKKLAADCCEIIEEEAGNSSQTETVKSGPDSEAGQTCDDDCEFHKMCSGSKHSFNHLNFSHSSEAQFMKNSSSDSVQVSPIRQCVSCKNCPQCSKLSLQKPMNEEIIALEKLIKESVRWDEKENRFIITYPHNELLQDLPENEGLGLKAMESLERRLSPFPDLLSQLNDAFLRMKNDKVFVPVSEVKGLENLQKSYICLTYSLGKTDVDGKNKLRLCCNSSLGKISFNDTCPQSPPYLEKLQALLCRWRTYNHFAYADIKQCYTQCLVSLLDSNLRRVYFREGGLGGTGPWVPYVSARVTFGDTLGGNCVSEAISVALRSKLDADVCREIASSTMMDDIGVPGGRI